MGEFNPGYDTINGLTYQSTAPAYTVQAGDTLQSIAQSVWGDANFWYLIANANGLDSTSTLTAGQVLAIPNKVANAHNSSTTYDVYDPNAHIGDVSPTQPFHPHMPNGTDISTQMDAALTEFFSKAGAAGTQDQRDAIAKFYGDIRPAGTTYVNDGKTELVVSTGSPPDGWFVSNTVDNSGIWVGGVKKTIDEDVGDFLSKHPDVGIGLSVANIGMTIAAGPCVLQQAGLGIGPRTASKASFKMGMKTEAGTRPMPDKARRG